MFVVVLCVGYLNEIRNSTDRRNVYNKTVASLWRDFLKVELERKINPFHLKFKKSPQLLPL